MSQTADQISNGLTVATGVANAIMAAVPAAAPYGVAIDLALSLAQKVAPPLYDELATLVERIKGGYTPTDADIASLRSIVTQLKTPDSYFHESLAELKTMLAAQPAALVDALKSAMDDEPEATPETASADLNKTEATPAPATNTLGHVSPMA